MIRTTKETLRVEMEWFKEPHLKQIEAIEKDSFPRPMFRDEIKRLLNMRNCIGIKAEHNGFIIGFMIYELYRTRYELVDLAVMPKFRNLSVGRQLITRLLNKLTESRRPLMCANVRETNMGAQYFFQRLGFLATKVVPDYFSKHSLDHTMPEDAYRFEYRI